ncbi:MAG TPA: hypothetical protein VE178_12110 [Silvibacterium sp.]|nr:hypothetical protein [Silvibacterium sp.]
MFLQCRHIQTNGSRCRQIALNERPFCYYHQNRQPRRRRSMIRLQPHTQTQTYDYGAIPVAPQIQPPVDLLFPEDSASIQINLYRIAVAQAENRIDTRTANSMTWNQQVCLINLARKPLIEVEPARPASRRTTSHDESSDSDYSDSTTYTDAGSNPSCTALRPLHRVILTPDGDEIAPPVEILEDNEAEPIHHKGCPCLLCAEKYRNQPPEEHHPNCQCGLCEEQSAEHSTQSSESSMNCHPERTLSEAKGESKDLLLPETGTDSGNNEVGCPIQAPVLGLSGHKLSPELCALSPGKRVARASSLLSGTTSRDPLNRPWSVAEYTFGDAIRRHEAQYAARAAAALAVGIEPPPYEPFMTGLHAPGTPEREEDEQMQEHSSEYWAEHFRKQIAETQQKA